MANVRKDSRLRLSGVSFLNAQPILHGMLSGMGHDKLRLSLEQPAELSRQLFEGEVDAALAPVAPLATHGGLEIVPGVAIGCDGPVRSVLLVADAPFESLDEVLLDAASRTSVILARLILRHLRDGGEPTYCARPASEIVAGVKGATGGLLIGDPALEVEGRFSHVIDLGQAWKELTGLPFVFALWIARPGALTPSDCGLLKSSLEHGLADLPGIAGAWQRGHGGSAEAHQGYLRDSIRYELDEFALEGLAEFYRRAAVAGLLPECKLKFVQEREPGRELTVDSLKRARQGQRLSVVEGLALHEGASAAQLRQLSPRPVDPFLWASETRWVSYSDLRGGQGATREELVAEISAVVKSGVHRVVLTGQIEPRFQLEWFEHLFGALAVIPGLELYGMSPDEVVAISVQEDLTIAAVVRRLANAGLTLLYGGKAHVLTDRVRTLVAPGACSSRAWLEVLRLAHRAGMKSVATMTFGAGEYPLERILHLIKLRDLQDETGGVLSIVLTPASAPCSESSIGEDGEAPEDNGMRLLQVARVLLDNVPDVLLAAPVDDRGAEVRAISDKGSSVAAHVSKAPRGVQTAQRVAR